MRTHHCERSEAIQSHKIHVIARRGGANVYDNVSFRGNLKQKDFFNGDSYVKINFDSE